MDRKLLKLALGIAALVGIVVVGIVLFRNQLMIETQRRVIASYTSAEPRRYDDIEELNLSLKREFDEQMSEFSQCNEKILRMVEKYQLDDVKKALGDPEFNQELFSICVGSAAQEIEENY